MFFNLFPKEIKIIKKLSKIKEQKIYRKTVKIVRTFSIIIKLAKWKMEVNRKKAPSLCYQYSIERIPSTMIAAQDKTLC
jgi:hypothetical protein